MTTPYILIEISRADWLDSRKRSIVYFDSPEERTRLHHLLKYGPMIQYWKSVFKGVSPPPAGFRFSG